LPTNLVLGLSTSFVDRLFEPFIVGRFVRRTQTRQNAATSQPLTTAESRTVI
jgi:hypothetical protein